MSHLKVCALKQLINYPTQFKHINPPAQADIMKGDAAQDQRVLKHINPPAQADTMKGNAAHDQRVHKHLNPPTQAATTKRDVLAVAVYVASSDVC